MTFAKRIVALINGLLMAALLASPAAAQVYDPPVKTGASKAQSSAAPVVSPAEVEKKPSRARRALGFAQAVTGFQFEMPAVRNVAGINIGGNFQQGASIEGSRIELTNAAPMEGTLELYAGVRHIASLGPGDSAVDHRRLNLLDAEVPIVGFYYNPQREFLGMVSTRIWFSANNTTPQVVVFRDSDIRRAPTGERFVYTWSYNAPMYPLPATRMERKAVKVPREWFDGVNGIQVVNASGFEITISSAVNGPILSLTRDQLLGQITERYRGYFSSATNYLIITWWQRVGDQRLLVRASDPIRISAPSQGVWAEQMIVWADRIERR